MFYKMVKRLSILILCSCISFLALNCKSDNKSDKNKVVSQENAVAKSELSTLKGEFIHVDTAAVLKVNNNLYGVKMDDMAKSVIKEADKIMTDAYDVINVVVKAEINPNTEPEGWEEIITIKTLNKIYKSQPAQETKVLKYSSNKSE